MPVLGDKPRIERGAILLQGEYRLLHGNPFRRRLRFEARVADYDAKSPNLNVALWTHDGDLVTPEPLEPPDRRSARLSDRKPKMSPNDFFVFGMGHAPRANNPAQFWEVGREDLIVPSYVILSGAHGSKKGKDQEGLVDLWRRRILMPLEGKLRARSIVLELEPNGSFRWNRDGWECYNPAEDPNSAWRDQLAKPDSEGSLSLFTNGSKVWYQEIVVEGEINPKWLRDEAKRRAKLRFDSLEKGSSIEPLIQKAR